LWRYYIQLTEIEQAFKELKGDGCGSFETTPCDQGSGG
jgi:hypothetical protein